MPGRTQDLDKYRYAYNGMESDNELSGTGNSYTTEFRQYDPRIARWKSLDPLMFPHMSPYVAFDNNPIYYTDPYGLASEGGDGEPDLTNAKREDGNDKNKMRAHGLPENPEEGKVYKSNLGISYRYTKETGYVSTIDDDSGQSTASSSKHEGGYKSGLWAQIAKTNLNNRFDFNKGIGTGGSPFKQGPASKEVKQQWNNNRSKVDAVTKVTVGAVIVPLAAVAAVEMAPIALSAYSSATDAAIYGYLSLESAVTASVNTMSQYWIGRTALTAASVYSGYNFYNLRTSPGAIPFYRFSYSPSQKALFRPSFLKVDNRYIDGITDGITRFQIHQHRIDGSINYLPTLTLEKKVSII